MIKKPIDFTFSKWNTTNIKSVINKLYPHTYSTNSSAHLAFELYEYLLHQDTIESEFYLLSDLNDYNKFFFKYFIASHVELISRRLKNESLLTEALYFREYFKRVLLGPLYENTIYKNIYYDDFESYLIDEYVKIYNLARNDFPKCTLFNDFLNKKLERYLIAHYNMLHNLDINHIFNKNIGYGLKLMIN